MRKVLFFLSSLVIFGCSDDAGVIKEDRKTVTLHAILNENSTSHSTLNNSIIYQTSAGIAVPLNPRVKNITIHSITVKVLNYDCSTSEIYCQLLTQYNLPNGISIDSWGMQVNENFMGAVPDQEFLNGLANQLKTHGTTSIDFQGELQPDVANFKIELGIDLDMTITYAPL